MTKTTDEIEVLEGLEAVRRRPAMYVGDVHGAGLDEVWRLPLLDMVEQHRWGEVRRLRVDLGEWLELECDGRSLGGDHPLHGPLLPLALTVLHGGLHGGLPIANALSERLEVETRDGTRRWRTAYAHGRRVDPIVDEPWPGARGTRLRLRPDPATFGARSFDEARLVAELEQLAWRHPLLEITWQGRVLPQRDGLVGWVAAHGGDAHRLGVGHVRRVWQHVELEVAFGWRSDSAAAPRICSFADERSTEPGDDHHGLIDGLVAATDRCAPARSTRALREVVQGGLVAFVATHGWHRERRGNRLSSPEVRAAVARAVEEGAASFGSHLSRRA